MTVLGASAMLDRMRPASAAALERARDPDFWGPADHAGWAARIEQLRQAEGWSQAHEDEDRRVVEALAAVPIVDRVITKLRGELDLEDADFFVLKRFLFHAGVALSGAAELLENWGVTDADRARVDGIRQALHPEKVASARFRLSAALKEGLTEARREAKKCRAAFEEARTSGEEAVVAALGGGFDLRGFYRPDDGVAAAALAQVDALALRDGRWVLADDGVDTARSALEEARAAVERLETELRAELTAVLSAEVERIARTSETLVELDLRLAVVRLKRDISGCWPEWGDATSFEAGRDIRLQERLGDEVQPVDAAFEPGATVVTGPNMGGKSALLRLLGLIQWAAQHGLPVPCRTATVRFVERVVYIGSEEPLASSAAQGLSSFGREVRRLVEHHKDDATTLWLLDEFGRGTHPDDGAALAIETITRLADEGGIVVATSHFPAVAAEPTARHLRIRGLVDEPALTRAVKGASSEDELRDALQHAMDYQPVVVEGDDVPRDARIVARALGLWRDTDEEGA